LKKALTPSEFQVKRIKGEIERLRNDIAKAPDDKAKETLKSVVKVKEKELQAIADELRRLDDIVKSKQKKRDDEKEIAAAYQASVQLIEEVTLKGRLEYRIYLEVEKEKVELFRTKGFPQEA
jgi:hypothetical protein